MLWITGSRGLLGSALSAKCKSILHFETAREVDIADRDAVYGFLKNNPGITYIINCAAFSRVDAAENCREEAYRTNALGPENLAIMARDFNAKLIHISTDYVFSGKVKRPLTEKDPVGPCSYYGETKLIGEERALAHSACVIRTSWIFGSGGKNFVSKLLKMLQTQKEIRLTDDQWGRFTYAPDLADAILRMLDQTGLYQFANIGIATKYEFGLAMREEAFLMRFPIMTEAIIPVPSAAFPASCERPDYSAFDTLKIESLIPIRHWRQALRDFLCEQQPAYL
jgi:dTDP-4-dehydrorhamnose reductase